MKNLVNAPPPQRNPIDVPIVHIIYEVTVKFNRLVIKFPKSQRHSLGQTCNNSILYILEQVIAAANTLKPQFKLQFLQNASMKLDLLKILIRLCRDCECISDNNYLEIQSQLQQIGRMLGGWLKSIN